MSYRVAAIDPGYRQSALVVFDGVIREHRIEENEALLERLEAECAVVADVLVLEQMQLFSGHGVGIEVFDSVYWSGMFAHAWKPQPVARILRSRVRGHHQASKGGDSAVRAALISRFGPYKEDAIGSKSKPGPLYGIKADEWSALAIATCWWDLHRPQAPPGRLVDTRADRQQDGNTATGEGAHDAI